MEHSARHGTKDSHEQTGSGDQREKCSCSSREREEGDRRQDRDEHGARSEFSSKGKPGCESGGACPGPRWIFAPLAARPHSLAEIECRRHEKSGGRIEADNCGAANKRRTERGK